MGIADNGRDAPQPYCRRDGEDKSQVLAVRIARHLSTATIISPDPNNGITTIRIRAASSMLGEATAGAEHRFSADRNGEQVCAINHGIEAVPECRSTTQVRSGLPKMCGSTATAPEGAVSGVWSGLELAHIVDVHIVGITAKAALGDFGGFGHGVSLDFVGLHFVVEVFYIDLEHTELRAVGTASLAADVVGVFERGEERGLNCSCHDFEV